ncbi:hypothetical protein L3Y34_013385 [Caenorhabditis briggsae]|uniref:Uncharacterized protein n=1 Tax=Caenorhabditis briggsae TaxID=6238 RepID=A0AAE8ZU89_CAEBR|nr:hypothetical protein L3Y34_013385 [Caenorhabditis briggsae]
MGYRSWVLPPKLPFEIRRVVPPNYVIFDLPEDPTQLQKNLIWPLYLSVQRKKDRCIKVLISGNERVEDLEPLVREMERHEVDTPQWLLDELKMIDESLYCMSLR